MANSPLDFPSTQTFRNRLNTRNLVPYPKSPRRYTPPLNFPYLQSDYEVIDSPDSLIDTPIFANQLYPLNQYGADGGFNQYADPNTLMGTHSGEGEYGVQDAHIIDEAAVQANGQNGWKNLNAYGDGLTLIDSAEAFSTLEIMQINQSRQGNAQPYPTTFLASFYSPLGILLSDNPRGSNGSLSQDSFIARLGAKTLKKEFQDRIAREIRRQTIGRANIFNANSGSDILGMATGTIPLIEPNYQITIPLNPITAAAQLALSLAGSTIPLSLIPGSYFDASINSGQPTTTQQLQNAYLNTAGQSSILGAASSLLSNPKTGSQIFLENTGAGQKSRLFKNLDYNRFKPGYDRGTVNGLGPLVGAITNNSNYYIGSTTSEPSRVLSPSRDLPVNEFGQEQQTEVYGPTDIAKLYEGETSKNIKLGSNGPIYSDGGGIEGGMTWVSPKYKNNAGKKVGPGGSIVKEDTDFKSSSYAPTESTTLNFRAGSILDETQRLINSQPQGAKRLQHVGNAIDQVSKVFNDGYRELTKGSRVLAYVGDIGQEKGAEYCRVFAKDTPYLQHNDLQKTDGMTTEGRRFSFSVFDKTYNLNMYPNKREGGQDSTNLVMGGVNGEYAKKYMFSLENLAWRTSNRPGYTVQDLPVCERGPNGGRVMWFAPYGLTFNEGSSANWKSTDFIGRPEPVYTYNNTTRTGSLTWKIVVDHPAVLNVIVNKVLAKETNKARIDSILESFFAGCRKYDLYELTKKYYTLNPNDIIEIQKELQYVDTSVERIRYIKSTVQTGEEGTQPTKTSTPTILPDLKEYIGRGVYFGNDYPKPGNDAQNYTIEYNRYTSPSNKQYYTTNNPNGNTDVFFTNVVDANYKAMDELAGKISELLSNSQNQGSIILTIGGSASAPATQTYNVSLSQRRINALKTYFENNSKVSDFIKLKRLKLENGRAEGEGATVQAKQLVNGQWQTGPSVVCSDEGTKQGDNVVGSKEIVTTNAMSCRRAFIVNIDTTSLKAPDKEETTPGKPGTIQQQEIESQEPYTETVKVPQEVTKTVVRDNISKRIVRSLLSECDYFETIKEETPMVYDNLREKLKFFNPAFHSTTPEGLNSRLTFLQQCLRPGDTIPVVKKDGTLQYNNATNTAFGAPPVLVLRVGDFFHTKIIPDNLQLTYENLDINPEGIGIQPMIANVTLSFKFVGGQGLAGAVDRIQNALSFNYYANTEMYDDRADVTDTSYKVLDKAFLDYFNVEIPPPTVGQIPNINGQTNNQTIGVITSATTTQTGDYGDINYQAFMNGFKDSTQNYFKNVLNKNREVFKQFNNAVMQNWSMERNYTKGSFQAGTGNNDTYIFGKPNNVQSKIDTIFNEFINDINSDNEGLVNFLKGTVANPKNFAPRVISTLKDNYKKYITTTKKNTFQSALTKIIQDICLVEQNLILNISKANTLSYTSPGGYGTDGLQQKNGKVQIYLISGTTNVSPSNKSIYSDTFVELKGDIVKIKNSLISFDTLTQTGVTFNGYSGKLIYTSNEITKNQTFIPFSSLFVDRYLGDVYKQNSLRRCYFILNDDIIDTTKYSVFKKALIGNILTNPSLFKGGYDALEKEFDAYWLTDDNINNLKSVKTIFNDENTLTDKFLNELETKTFKNYLNFIPFDATTKRQFTFRTDQQTINIEGNIQQKELLIKSLGLSTNSNNDNKTWNDNINSVYIGKVKLN